MSNRARRILAIAVCVVIGTICLIEGTRAMNGPNRLAALALLPLSGFLLLSAVGLAKPWLRPLNRR